jgi:hypothetical protein
VPVFSKQTFRPLLNLPQAVCKASVKGAIRNIIKIEREHYEANERKKKEAEEKGEVYMDDIELKGEVPPINMQAILESLRGARKSVSATDLQKYMSYKRDMERRLGMDEGTSAAGTVIGLDRENRAPAPSSSSSSSSGGAGGGAGRFDPQPADELDIYAS